MLYIFLHIQKCAGTTFGTHIENKLRPDQTIALYEGYRTFNIPKRTWEYIESRDDVERLLSSLTEDQKKNVKGLYGRYLYYGIHKYFKQTPRYVLFVREPASRIVSNYNHFRKISETAIEEIKKTPSQTHKNRLQSIYNEMHHNEKPVPFEFWFGNRAQQNFMTNHLIETGFIEVGLKDVDRQDIRKGLDKFYFVGLVEHFDTDAPFIYSKLGILGSYMNQNISHKYYTPEDQPRIEELILSKNLLDRDLYEYARYKNKLFKRMHVLEFLICRLMSTALWRNCSHPIVFLYRVSVVFKRHSSLYTELVRLVKSVR